MSREEHTIVVHRLFEDEEATMAQELRFGIITLQNAPWPVMVERWQYLEALGFDSVWLADHFVNPYQPTQPWLEAWTLLAALATQTARIRIGTLVSPFVLRNPAVLARQALTLDHISNGRLEVGLGAGNPADISYAMAGIPVWNPPEQVARFREVVEIVDSMLCNEVTTYEGRYYQVKQAHMYPGPVQRPRPPLTIAANGPAMLKIAARYADTWNTFLAVEMSQAEALDLVRQRNTLLDEHCVQIGRDPCEIGRSILIWRRVIGTNPFASVEAFQDLVGRYRDAGMHEFVFYYPPQEFYQPAGEEQSLVFERVASEVIPALRAEAAREGRAVAE